MSIIQDFLGVTLTVVQRLINWKKKLKKRKRLLQNQPIPASIYSKRTKNWRKKQNQLGGCIRKGESVCLKRAQDWTTLQILEIVLNK